MSKVFLIQRDGLEVHLAQSLPGAGLSCVRLSSHFSYSPQKNWRRTKASPGVAA